MSPEQFQADRELREGLAKLYRSDRSFVQALEVLRDSNLPAHKLDYNVTDPNTSIALTHAHQAGVHHAIRFLRSLAFPPSPPKPEKKPYEYVAEPQPELKS